MAEDKLKILLVDDIDFFRDVMRDYFKRTPVDIFMASDGEEAIEVALRQAPDLIYMDVAMPGMDGLAACRKIKAHPTLCRVPVLLIFTPDRDASEADVKSAGCDGYLKKPFGREEFLNLGHRYLFNIERRERRVPCQVPVDFTLNGVQYQSKTYDISLHGVYIEYRDELPPDRRVELSYAFPGDESARVTAKGRISWVNQGFPRTNLSIPQGFGVEIQSIEMSSVDLIRAYIEKN